MGSSVWLRGVFYLLVALCLAQLAWWTYFAFRASGDVERLDLLHLESNAFHAVHAIESLPLAEKPVPARETEIRSMLSREYPSLELDIVAETATADRPVVRSFDAGKGMRFVVSPKSSARDAAIQRGESTRRMFVHESIAFVLVVLTGVLLIKVLSNREARLRAQQSRFLTGATHELKTPLASLRLGLQSFAEGSIPSEKLPSYAIRLAEQVDRLEMDIENLLRSAAGGDKRFDTRPGDLCRDVDEVAQEFSQRFGAFGLQLEVEHGSDGVIVARDRSAVRQVLRNLLDNACKYSPRGGHIHLRVRCDESDAFVEVRDEGRGVAPSDRDRIFERFYRGESEEGQATGGTGLGLWLSRRLARAHGGELRLVPEDKGACFELRLPRDARGVVNS